MMRRFLSTCAVLLLAFPASTELHADEAEFLRLLAGNWAGGGQVRLTPASSPVRVSCRFDGASTESSAALEGICTGLIIFSRQVGARVEVENGAYVGSYVGSERGTAQLRGTREGRALDLALQWPGHPPARMTLSSPADGRMILTTVEQHPETGEGVVTAELELERR